MASPASGGAANTAMTSPTKPVAKPAPPTVPPAPAVAYLRLESAEGPVKGEATDAAHRNWFALSAVDKRSISDGAAKGQARDAAKMSTGAGASGGSHAGTIQVRKEIDKASPLLAQACASGKHFPTAQLDLLDGGVWKHYQFMDVIISSVQSSGGDRPTESISFTFQKIEME